jgi:tRNA threonylcarbamoyladenosine biosynthesis protein TsaB
MRILGLDTATHTASAAILDDDRVLAHGELDTSGHDTDVLELLDRLCREAGVAPAGFGAVAVGAGPGSFTGLRIGMATAKGIAFAARCPLWAVSSLAAVAQGARRAGPIAADGMIVAALDARRGEVYLGCFAADGAVVRPLGEERVVPPGEVAGIVAALCGTEAVTIAGDARAKHGALVPGARWLEAVTTPSGIAIAELAAAGARVDVLIHGAPSYVRPSEAEVMYPDGVPGARRTR